MPIKKAAEKALRQTKKRTAARQKSLKELEMVVSKMRRFLGAEQKSEAQKIAPAVQKKIDKSVKARLISRNKAQRLKSKLFRLLAKL